MNTVIIDTKIDERFFIILVGNTELFKVSKANNLENVKAQFEKEGTKVVVR